MAEHNQEAIIVNYIGRKGAGALVAYEMTKALLKRGENVIPIIPLAIENKSLWDRLGCERVVYLDSYIGVASYVIKSIFWGKIKKSIIKGLEGIEIKAVYSPMACLWTGKINKMFLNTKKIVVCHDPKPHSGKDRYMRVLIPDAYRTADIVIVHTKKFIPYLENKYKDTRYIPMGPHNMYRMIENKTSIVKYDEKKVNFLFFGRIDEYKGLELLLRAFLTLEKKYKDKISLTVAGRGDISKYEKYFKEMSCVNVINRWIEDREVESLFVGENIVTVCPYKDATQSGVILVSYDYGIPVIATNTGGLNEQLIDGRTGILIPPDNMEELSEAMEKFIMNPDIFRRFRNGISEYMSGISWDKSAELLMEIIDS